MRTLCASTLLAEVFVIGFAGLVAMKSDGLSVGTVWTVCGVAMVLCLLLCGMITRPGGVQLGWALQIALIASGVVVPAMFVLGAVFAALWWASVHYGRVIDQAKARWAEQGEGQSGGADGGHGGHGGHGRPGGGQSGRQSGGQTQEAAERTRGAAAEGRLSGDGRLPGAAGAQGRAPGASGQPAAEADAV